ncbi:MAG: hypothetical protein WCF20_00630 [Methylovirgula sp.]
MKRVFIFELLLLGAACVFSLASAAKVTAQEQQAALFGPTKYDGIYSVEAITQDGSCANTHWTVAVANGLIASVSPNDANITASGLIEDDGVVSMTFRGGENQIAHVGGAIKGRNGKGSWSSPTLLCGGIWHAEKKK